jgi:Helix-turn-helix domain
MLGLKISINPNKPLTMLDSKTIKKPTTDISYMVKNKTEYLENTETNNPLLSLDDAQELYGISKYTIRSWCSKKKIQSEKISGRFGLETRIRKAVIEQYIASNPTLQSDISINENRISLEQETEGEQTPNIPLTIDPNKPLTNPNNVKATPNKFTKNSETSFELIKQNIAFLEKQLAVKDDQLSQKDKQIDGLMGELKESRNQANTILMRINDNMLPMMESQQKMLDSQSEKLAKDNSKEEIIEEVRGQILQEISQLEEEKAKSLTDDKKPKKWFGLFQF